MIIYMMRHGETDWNRNRLLQGWTDVPLNENGRKVAELTREGLKHVNFDIAFCSPLCRAKETAEIILRGRGVELIEDERVKEMGFGAYEATDLNHKSKDLEMLFREPHRYQDTKGVEAFESVLKRGKSFLDELIANPRYQDSTILIATHGAILRGMICVLKGKTIADFWEGGVHKNCGMTIVEVKDGVVQILKEAVIAYEDKGEFPIT